MNQFTRMKLVYVLILIIPIVSLWCFYSLYLMPKYKSNLLNSCRLAAQNSIDALSEKFYTANSLSVQLHDDATLNKLKYMPDDVLPMMDARKRLESYNVVNGIFDEIILVYENGKIISSKTVYSQDSLCEALGGLGSEKPSFFDDITSIQWISLEKNLLNDTRAYTVGMYPLPLMIGQRYALAVIKVDSQKFLDSVFRFFPYSDAAVFILDENKNVVMSNSSAKDFEEHFTNGENNGTLVKAMRSEEYLFYGGTLARASGLNVQIFVPSSSITSEFDQLQFISFALVAVVTLLCILIMIIFILAYRKSVIALRKTLKSVDNNASSEGDDLLNATRAILSLERASSELEEHLSNSQRVVEELERYKFELKERVSQNTDVPEISSSWNYVLSNYADYNLSVHILADMLNMSDAAFTQKFKAKYKITPNEFITNTRIDRVKELLITTNMPINAIIEQVGYFDVSSFIRKFKKTVGVTPGKYREDFKKK